VKKLIGVYYQRPGGGVLQSEGLGVMCRVGVVRCLVRLILQRDFRVYLVLLVSTEPLLTAKLGKLQK
jgi:hypothetical protein